MFNLPQTLEANHDGIRAWAVLLGISEDGPVMKAVVQGEWRTVTLSEACAEFQSLSGKPMPEDKSTLDRWWMANLTPRPRYLNELSSEIGRTPRITLCPAPRGKNLKSMLCRRADSVEALNRVRAARMSPEPPPVSNPRQGYDVDSITGTSDGKAQLRDWENDPWTQELLNALINEGMQPPLARILEMRQRERIVSEKQRLQLREYRCVFVAPSGRLEGEDAAPGQPFREQLWLSETAMHAAGYSRSSSFRSFSKK